MDGFLAKRQTVARQMVARKKWHGLLVTHAPNIFYLSGFSGSAGALLVEPDRCTLFVDGRYKVQAREQADGCRVRDARGGPLDGFCEHLGGRRRAILAVEASHLTLTQRRRLGRRLRGGTVARWVSTEGFIESLRSRKDAGEIRAMRAAAKLGGDVLNRIARLLRPGMTELELAAEIEFQMKRQGASGPSFETIVASGPRSALPHARPTSRKLRKNELVVVDMGAILGHYCSDLTRTFYLGRPPRRAQRWHSAVREAHRAAAEALRPGVRTGEIDQVARGILRREGLEPLFIHSTGHGLGLEIHEEPRLAKGQKTKLEEGNVVTIEPGVYLEGYGGIRIEDDYVITNGGAERLTETCKDVFAI